MVEKRCPSGDDGLKDWSLVAPTGSPPRSIPIAVKHATSAPGGPGLFSACKT